LCTLRVVSAGFVTALSTVSDRGAVPGPATFQNFNPARLSFSAPVAIAPFFVRANDYFLGRVCRSVSRGDTACCLNLFPVLKSLAVIRPAVPAGFSS
jgi:hypothetical protein